MLLILTDMRMGVMVVMMTLKWEDAMCERLCLHIAEISLRIEAVP